MRKIILPILLKHKGKDTLEDTLEVLVYEVGDVVKCIHRMRNRLKDSKLYEVECRKALADVATQVRLLCEWLDIPFGQLLEEGFQQFKVQMKEYYPLEGVNASR